MKEKLLWGSSYNCLEGGCSEVWSEGFSNLVDSVQLGRELDVELDVDVDVELDVELDVEVVSSSGGAGVVVTWWVCSVCAGRAVARRSPALGVVLCWR